MKRSCGWMSGPADASIRVPAAKWWFAISRDMLANAHRRQRIVHRTPVACHRTPTFVSPLPKRSSL